MNNILRYKTNVLKINNKIISKNLDRDSLIFIDAVATSDGTILTDNQKYAVDYLVRNLKMEGIWTNNQVAIYPMIGGTSGSTSINLVNPGTFDIDWYGTNTFSSTGVTSNGITGYGDTNLIPIVSISTTNNGAYFSICNEITTTLGDTAGSYQTTNSLCLYKVNDSVNNIWCRLYGSNAVVSVSNTGTITGNYYYERTSVSDLAIYKNGIKVAENNSSTDNSSSIFPFFLNARNNSGTATNFSDACLGFVMFGEAITSKVSRVNDIINNYNILKQL